MIRILGVGVLAIAGLTLALVDPGGIVPASGARLAPGQAQNERALGCTPRRPFFRVHGRRGRRRLALTFDGGPSRHTAGVLRVLRRHRAHATFFLRGDAIPGRRRTLRRTIADGHELANHSFSHPHLPSYGELARTSRLIRRATGFKPCLFRPPFGEWNARLIGDARRLGMLTVYWDVDSHDSVGAGAATIYARVTGLARGGSIVLMHDGEGQRGATRAALPRVLRTLRRRRYELVTVSQLLELGQRVAGPPVSRASSLPPPPR